MINNIVRITHALIISSLLRVTSQQHIFDKTCEYKVNLINKTDILRFASQNIHISNNYYDVYINFCDSLLNGGLEVMNCDKQSWLCILNKRNRRNTVKRPVIYFQGNSEYNNESKTESIFLKTNDLGDCQDDKFGFLVIVDKTSIDYKISSPNECNMELTIPHPKTLHRDGSHSYNGLIIDMRPLRNYPEQIITLNSTKIAIAALHIAPSCASQGSMICEINSNGNIFSVAEHQHVNYDGKSNMITLRGKKTAGKLKSEVQIKCNWTADFEDSRKQLAKYKYTVESRYGCVKLPFNCQVTDYENYEYDISSLNKSSGWLVSGASDLKINICGTLVNPANTECANRYSQVCSFEKGARVSSYISYGALHSGLVSDGQQIKLTYTHGSRCFVKSDEFFTTRVVLQCNRDEMGPVLQARENCTVDIVWKTPAACAKGIKATTTFGYENVVKDLKKYNDFPCDIIYNGQLFRLGSLKTSGMRFESLLRKGSLIYSINICQPIAITKDNYYCGVTGACVEDMDEINVKKRFTWVGSLVKPAFENDQLVIHYKGGACVNTTHREVVISFNCSLQQEPLRLSSESLCRADFTWNTPLACKKKTQRSLECQTPLPNGSLIDFAELKLHNFTLFDENVAYHVDLCSSAIITNRTAVPGDLINTTRKVIRTGCFYSLIYEFSAPVPNLKENWAITPPPLMINVSFLCDEIRNNFSFESAKRNGNEIFVQVKDTYFCSFINCDDKKVEVTTTTRATSTLQDSHSDHDTTVELQQPIKHFALNNCKIVNDHHEMLLSSINHRFVAKDIAYTIGSSVSDKLCNGFVCKNNITLATLEICPSRTFIEDESKVELLLLGPKCTSTGKDIQVKVVLKCLPDHSDGIDDVKLISANGCSTEFCIENSETCLFFPEIAKMGGVSQGSSYTGYIIGIVVCIVLIILLSVIIWKYQTEATKCFKRGYGETPTRTGLLYMKEASD